MINFPTLNSNNREREFKFYNDNLKAQVIYEHLFNDKTHRWMDINILGRNGNTEGRESANILYYLGIRANHRGILKGLTLEEGIQQLENSTNDYSIAIILLNLIDSETLQSNKYLYEQVRKDSSSEETENGYKDGAVRERTSVYYERNFRNRRLAIEIHGTTCMACGFNFEEIYGEHGKDYIEIHHVNPLSLLQEEIKIDVRNDLVPLCANCHRMVHRKQKEPLTIEQLKQMINKNS